MRRWRTSPEKDESGLKTPRLARLSLSRRSRLPSPIGPSTRVAMTTTPSPASDLKDPGLRALFGDQDDEGQARSLDFAEDSDSSVDDFKDLYDSNDEGSDEEDSGEDGDEDSDGGDEEEASEEDEGGEERDVKRARRSYTQGQI